MPKSDAKFPFHFKIMQGIGELGDKLLGESRKLPGFIVELNSDGHIIKTVSEADNLDFIQLDEKFKSYLMIDVIDHGEYIYIKWQDLSKEHIETLLNTKFIEKDFVDSMGITKGYTRTGSVMF